MKYWECLKAATSYLEENGITSARVNAEVILEDTLRLSRSEIYARYGEDISPEMAEKYFDRVQLRGRRFPLQYITCTTSFFGLNLEVTPGVFIPRPETETLVEKALEILPLIDAGQVRVLDIGTGSGNIAVAIASLWKDAHVTAVDISPLALKIAKKNLENHGILNRAKVVLSDLFCALDSTVDRFDMIVSNPPYIAEPLIGSLDPEVRFFEPAQAINGGHDGLFVTKKIIDRAPDFLNDGGFLLLETDPGHIEALSSFISDPWGDVEFFEDLSGRTRVMVARKSR